MSPHRRVSAQRPPSAQWSGVAGVSRTAWAPKTRVLRSNSGILGSQRPVFFALVLVVGEIGPHFPHFSISIPRWPCRLSVPEPAVDGRCRRRCDPYRCACLPAHASNPADQLSLFPSAVQVVRSHRERLDLLQALTSVTRWTRRDSIVTVTTPVTIPAAKMEAAFSLPQVRYRTHRGTRPSLSVSVARRGPAVNLVLEVSVQGLAVDNDSHMAAG